MRFRLEVTLALALSAFAGIACTPSGPPEGTVVAVQAVAVLPIESALPIEPSGLCLWNGELYSVSDDTDDVIFRIVREKQVARFEPFLHFTPPAGSQGRLDLEAIVNGPGGSFFLLSERHARILQVFPEGHSEWVTESLHAIGRQKGFFRVPGAGLEGLTRLGDGSFIVLVERQPRGWIGVGPEGVVRISAFDQTRFRRLLELLRIPDFTGADVHDGVLYTLFRNADAITTLEPDGNGWKEGPIAWSFEEITRSAQFTYADTRFGLAEGLAVDADHFYVVLDNNGTGRTQDPRDTRPLLLILARGE